MGSTMNEHEKILETHYENIIEELKTELSQYYEDSDNK